jgi:hypothetical protein
VRTLLCFLVVVLGGTLGEIAITRAMKRIGEVTRFTPLAVVRVLGRAFLLRDMWAGFALMALSFFAMLALLSWEDVSFVIPATAASYAAGAAGARFLLHEQVSRARWAGVLLVMLGVALVWLDK